MFETLLHQSKSAIQGVDTYLAFPENRLARAAMMRLSTARGSSNLSGSITMVYGPTGVGKSHLAKWTMKTIVHQRAKTKFLIASSRTVGELLRQADERQQLAELLEEFQALDILVCEELDWLEMNPDLQPLFVMLIEALEEASTQVLLTAIKPVGQIRGLDQRIVSRCHGGLCVPITPPGLESRTQLFQHWFRELHLPIMKPYVDSASFLAERLPLAPRELRHVVLALQSRQARKGFPIDVGYLERFLTKDDRAPRLSMDFIVDQVAHEFGVSSADIRSRSRQQHLAVPRQCAMWLARELTGRPLEQIGEYFDRSHTTVSHSLSRLEEQMPEAPSLRQQVRKLRKQLKELPREDCA